MTVDGSGPAATAIAGGAREMDRLDGSIASENKTPAEKTQAQSPAADAAAWALAFMLGAGGGR
jgi:hypothetical protein